MQRLACFCVAIGLAGSAPAFASAPSAGALTLPAPPGISVEYAHRNELFHCALDGEAPAATVIVKMYAYGLDAPHDAPEPWARASRGLFSELGRVELESASQAVAGNHNVIIAQLRLGDIAHLGELGQTRSDQVALRWYRLAAGQGDALAEQKIGDLFWQGSADLPRDRAEAVRHYSIAANKGAVPAARQLAIAYANGDGAPPDDLKMLRWQRMAAEGGDAEAAGMLGYAIMIGLDGTYDFVEAAMWLTLAAEQAGPNEWRAHTALYSQIAQSKLTPPEHEAFRARLARWRAILAGH